MGHVRHGIGTGRTRCATRSPTLTAPQHGHSEAGLSLQPPASASGSGVRSPPPGVTVQDNEQTWFVGGRAGGGGPAGGGRQRGGESGRRNRESRYDGRYDRAGFEPGRYDGGRGDGRYDGGNTGDAGYARGGREPGRYGDRYGGDDAGYDGGGRPPGRYGRDDDALVADGIAPRYPAPRPDGGDAAL